MNGRGILRDLVSTAGIAVVVDRERQRLDAAGILSTKLTVELASVFNNALISAIVPLMVTDVVPLLRPLALLLPAVTVSVPSGCPTVSPFRSRHCHRRR